MPGLPMEFWGRPTILAIAVEAGKPLDADVFTNHLQKVGYAKVRVEIDSTNPLSPRVLIEGKNSNSSNHLSTKTWHRYANAVGGLAMLMKTIATLE